MPLIVLLVLIAGAYAVLFSQSGGSSSSAPSADLAPGAAAPPPADQSAGAGLFSTLSHALTSMWTPPAAASPYLDTITAAENTYGLPSGLLARQLAQESAYNPNAVSAAGAVGIAQLEPATAADLGVDPTDPYASINAAARYMRSLYDQTGSWISALAAYNWGIGNVLKHGVAAAPAETQKYISTISADVPGLT